MPLVVYSYTHVLNIMKRPYVIGLDYEIHYTYKHSYMLVAILVQIHLLHIYTHSHSETLLRKKVSMLTL